MGGLLIPRSAIARVLCSLLAITAIAMTACDSPAAEPDFGPEPGSPGGPPRLAPVPVAADAINPRLLRRFRPISAGPPSRWDRFLTGEHDLLTPAERRGFKLFSSIGCMTCHSGEHVGGAFSRKLGLVELWPGHKPSSSKPGGRVADPMVMPVPSLRNVADTGPYFHDRSATSLPQAVQMMARYQLGVTLDDASATDIAAWLGALSAEAPL